MSALQPMTKQRSPWVEDQAAGAQLRHTRAMEPDVRVYRRNVHDGWLAAFTGTIPGQGCHLSISHRRPNGDPGRYPTWDEIAHARYELCPGEITMAMLLPPMAEYVAIHPTTFHLHETPPNAELAAVTSGSKVLGPTSHETTA